MNVYTCLRNVFILCGAQEDEPQLWGLIEMSIQTIAAQRDAHLVRRSAAGEEVPVVVAVDGHVEDAGVVVEGLLGAVAVVNVLQPQAANGGGVRRGQSARVIHY